MRFARSHQWTNSERLELLKICSDESIEKDWKKRAEAMAKKYSVTPLGYYFSAKVCHAEMERILSSPCPGLELNTSGQYSYSHKVIIEKWIAHYTKELEEERKRKVELAMIEVRRCSNLAQKLLEDSMSLEDMSKLMDQLVMENPKREENDQFKRVVSTYSNRLLDVWKKNENKKIETNFELGATNPAEPVQTSGFMTPPQAIAPPSTISSPIRSVADALKDAVPIFVEPTLPSAPPPSSTIGTQSIVIEEEEVEGNDIQQKSSSQLVKEEVKTEKEITDLPVEKKIEIKKEQQENDVKEEEEIVSKPRGRSKSKHQKIVGENQNMDSPSGKLKRNMECLEGAEVKGKKSRSSASTPNHSTTGGKWKGKKEDQEDKKSVKSIDSFEVPSAPLTPMPTEPKDVECQTILTIQGFFRASTPVDKRRSATTSSTPLRKSSRRADAAKAAAAAAAAASTPQSTNTGRSSAMSDRYCNVGSQTSRVEFDKDDIITMNWSSKNEYFIETVTLDRKRKAPEESAHDRNLEKDEEVIDEPVRRGSKSESRRELSFVVETDDVTAKRLIMEKGYKIASKTGAGGGGGESAAPGAGIGESPNKRFRKDEKAREEATNLKFQLNCMWRALSDHKHSGIFSHPVHEKDAPGYSGTIKVKMDLTTLKKEIESGAVPTKTAFLTKAYTMFANAIMFNSTGHDVNSFAKTMVRDVMTDILLQSGEDRKPGSSRRSKMIEDARSSQRALSLEPEPMAQLGKPGKKRTVFSRKQTNHVKKHIVTK